MVDYNTRTGTRARWLATLACDARSDWNASRRPAGQPITSTRRPAATLLLDFVKIHESWQETQTSSAANPSVQFWSRCADCVWFADEQPNDGWIKRRECSRVGCDPRMTSCTENIHTNLKCELNVKRGYAPSSENSWRNSHFHRQRLCTKPSSGCGRRFSTASRFTAAFASIIFACPHESVKNA
jgi:hypothetical protein